MASIYGADSGWHACVGMHSTPRFYPSNLPLYRPPLLFRFLLWERVFGSILRPQLDRRKQIKLQHVKIIPYLLSQTFAVCSTAAYDAQQRLSVDKEQKQIGYLTGWADNVSREDDRGKRRERTDDRPRKFRRHKTCTTSSSIKLFLSFQIDIFIRTIFVEHCF